MTSLLRGLLGGAAAGAAGTTALNATTYLDMAVRARPASSTPEQSVAAIAEKLGAGIPGDADSRENRLHGLGPLLGIVTGVEVGMMTGLLRRAGLRLPLPVGALLVGAAAMVGANAPMVGLGLTDPRSWGVTSWLSDAVPHLAYGLVTAATVHAVVPAR